MFEKIYIHSKYEQNKNKIPGIKELVCLFVMGLPFILVTISALAYFINTFNSKEFTITFLIMITCWTLFVGAMVISYLKNSSRIFAISKDKKIYVMNMSKEAVSYLSLHTAMQGMGNATAEAMERIEESDIEKNIKNSGLCIEKITRVVEKKRKLIIYGDFGKTSKMVIPYMYSEMGELRMYFKYIADGGNGKFKFHKRTKEDILNERIDKSPYKVFITIFCIVLWLFLYNFASDLNRYAHIRHNYQETKAVIEDVSKDDEGVGLKLSYNVEGKKVETEVSVTSAASYSKGDELAIYYNEEDVEKIVPADSVGFLIKPFIILLVGLESLVLVIKLLFWKK